MTSMHVFVEHVISIFISSLEVYPIKRNHVIHRGVWTYELFHSPEFLNRFCSNLQI